MAYKDKEKERETTRKYRENNKEKIRERLRIWRENNKEKIREKRRNYYLNNREKELALQRIWNSKNSKRKKEREKIYMRNRYHIDPDFKLRMSLRSRFWYELRKHLATKEESSLVYVGCSIKQLKEYLENKFEEGMTWDNWSINGWHVDHIVPCSSFDLTKEKEQKKCFHYTNLQPLWAKDNRAKHNKLDWVKECA